MNIIKIAVVGGESTGKTTLVKALAEKLKTVFAQEYARIYFQKHINEPYTSQAAINVINGQILNEDNAAELANKYLICDSEAITTMLWHEYLLKKSHPHIETMVHSIHYDYYLLCDYKDFEWEFDAIRRDRNSREWFHNRFIKELNKLNRSYKIVSGSVTNRLNESISYIIENQP